MNTIPCSISVPEETRFNWIRIRPSWVRPTWSEVILFLSLKLPRSKTDINKWTNTLPVLASIDTRCNEIRIQEIIKVHLQPLFWRSINVFIVSILNIDLVFNKLFSTKFYNLASRPAFTSASFEYNRSIIWSQCFSSLGWMPILDNSWMISSPIVTS